MIGDVVAYVPCAFCEKKEMCSMCELTLRRNQSEWISVEERLPEDGENVLICVGKVESARIEKGITEDEREKMKNGELEDPIEYGWSQSDGLKAYKRSQAYRGCDVFGNNLVPYCWKASSGHMDWFGQYATHWMPLPEPPKGDEGGMKITKCTDEGCYCSDCVKELQDNSTEKGGEGK